MSYMSLILRSLVFLGLHMHSLTKGALVPAFLLHQICSNNQYHRCSILTRNMSLHSSFRCPCPHSQDRILSWWTLRCPGFHSPSRDALPHRILCFSTPWVPYCFYFFIKSPLNEVPLRTTKHLLLARSHTLA